MMRPRLGFLLASLVIAIWWSFRAHTASTSRAEIAEPVSPRVRSTSAPTLPPSRSREPISAAASDPFYGAPKRAPTPPPMVATAPIMPPSAPSLPFAFFGRTTSPDGRAQVFLTRRDELLTVREHEVIDANYRVERITDDEVVFVYLPLAQTQTLRAQP